MGSVATKRRTEIKLYGTCLGIQSLEDGYGPGFESWPDLELFTEKSIVELVVVNKATVMVSLGVLTFPQYRHLHHSVNNIYSILISKYSQIAG